MSAKTFFSAIAATAIAACLTASPLFAETSSSVAAGAAGADTKPVVRRYVVDQADLLNVDTERRITEALARLHRQQDSQVVIVTVDDLQGQDINTFASQLGAHWGVAVHESEPGMMVVVAPKEQKVKLHVGPGLQAWMPEEMTRHIIANYMFPSFSQRNYQDGVINGAAGIIAILGQETPIGPKLQENGARQEAQVVRSSFTGAEAQPTNRAVTPASGEARDAARRDAVASAAMHTEGGMPSWLLFLLPLLVVAGAGAVLAAQRFGGAKSAPDVASGGAKSTDSAVAGEGGFAA